MEVATTNSSFRAMGTQVDILIDNAGPDQSSGQAIDAARSEIERLEQICSRFRKDSELNYINTHPGRWLDVSPELAEVLALAKRAFQETYGFFNPCLGQVMSTIGYDVTFDKVTMAPRGTPTHAVPYVPDVVCPFDIDITTRQARLEPGRRLDVGGVAKGWIVQQAANVIEAHGFASFLCNAGGDVVCRGGSVDSGWLVGVADPLDESRVATTIRVTNAGVATSGTYRRRWTSVDGTPMHHILDPFTGRPSQSDIISCTVVHEDLVSAEVLAKVALLLGWDKAITWLEARCLDWILIRRDGEVKRRAGH